MSDNNVMERLRALLDERGVEYETDERNAIVEWSTYYGAFVFFARQREGKLLVETTVATKHSVILTPEQAVAATLGGANVDDALALLDEMNERGRIEYSDYSRLHDAIAATLGDDGGKLTAKQVREAIERHAIPSLGCRWQFVDRSYEAIADELNAELGSGTCELREASWDDDTCTWGVICSSCGAKHEHTHGYGWNFAPCCGKVVKR